MLAAPDGHANMQMVLYMRCRCTTTTAKAMIISLTAPTVVAQSVCVSHRHHLISALTDVIQTRAAGSMSCCRNQPPRQPSCLKLHRSTQPRCSQQSRYPTHSPPRVHLLPAAAHHATLLHQHSCNKIISCKWAAHQLLCTGPPWCVYQGSQVLHVPGSHLQTWCR